MIIELNKEIIFKDAFVIPNISFFKRVVERFFDFFRAEGYPGMVIPYKWKLWVANVDTGIYVEAGKVVWAAEGWNVDCHFVEREPYFEPGYVYTHEMTIEHPANHIYFKLVYRHGDEVNTQLSAEVNMPPELESRFIPFMEEK
jgi:hypothetical protein